MLPFMDTAAQGAVEGVIFHPRLYSSHFLVTRMEAKKKRRYSDPRVLYDKYRLPKPYMK